LRPHLSGSIKAELQRGGALRFTVVDESGQPRTDKTGLPMSLRGAIETLRQDPDFAAAFASANASRKESGIEGLPFQPARQQIRLTREQAKNTEIYREAVKQAGVNNVIIADE